VSNPPRQKGTRYETRLLPWLRTIFGDQVERAPLKGTLDAGDFTGLPLIVEAKNTARPAVPEWCRVTAAKARTIKTDGDWCHVEREPWIVCWSGGDARKAGHPGELVIMSKRFAEELLKAWHAPSDS
jgi:hypothetical protein